MKRVCVLFLSAFVLLSACKTSPVVSSSSGLVRFGAGSRDDISAVETRVSTASPSAGVAVKKVKIDEILGIVSGFESEMDHKLASLDYVGAFAAFDSISGALSGIPAGNAKMQEIRLKMEKALDSIIFENISAPGETVAGSPFKKDFSVKVSVIANQIKKPLQGFPCTIIYPSVAADGSKIVATQNIVSGADGLVSFTAPVPARSGKDTVVVAASLNCKDSSLQNSITLRKEKGQLAVKFAHVASSNAKRLATTISILDFDKNGKAIVSSNVSATTLLKPLVQKGFGRIGMADFQKEIGSGDEAVLLKAAKAQFGSGVQRFIYGTARIESIVQGEDLQWTCSFVVQVSVWDFVLNSKVYSTEMRVKESAKTESAAIDAARKKVCGELLITDLYYNM